MRSSRDTLLFGAIVVLLIATFIGIYATANITP